MTPSKNEAAELRRFIAELQSSLSWRITAPLRFIAKPLFRARAPKTTVPLIDIGGPQSADPATNGPLESHGEEMTKIDAIDNLATPTIGTVCKWYHIDPKFAHAALETHIGAGYDRDIGDIHEFLARYEYCRTYLEYAFSANVRGQTLVKQLRDWGVPLEEGAKRDGSPRKSYLDVGFAYGGFLAAFASLGYDATGI